MSEKEYIEREAAINEIKAAQVALESDNDAVWEMNKKYFKGLAWAHNILLNIPAADVAPVVRCRDCKYGEIDDPDFPNQHYCRAGYGWNDADFYCSYGERKDGE